ncbi:MAG: hypothetical protein VX438_09700, partial [Planctomycetota bacterium]|nr:hypothetical protein [Planctomycetota bacterium]
MSVAFRLSVCVWLVFSTQVDAQVIGGPISVGPPVKVQTYRLENRTVIDRVPVTRYKEVKRTEMRTRKFVEKVPVQETSAREENYTYLKPVTQTKYREEIVEKTVWESTIEYREERHTAYKAVTETSHYDQSYVVQKPVTTTKTVNETITSLRPVTTYQQQIVDRGGYQNQWIYRPGNVTNRLGFVRPGYLADPRTGQLAYQLGGIRWVPQQNPGIYQF